MFIKEQAFTMSVNKSGHKPIDWLMTLKLASNKTALARDMLTMYMDDLPEAWADIRKAHSRADYRQLHHFVHKLHGASCYCGVPRIKLTACDLETALKRKHKSDIEQLMYSLKEAVDHTLDAYAAGDYE